MSEVKPIASLEPKLLARKGGARPAMRPQIFPFVGFEQNAAYQLDDLGWNDMGEDDYQSAEVLQLSPLLTNHKTEALTADSAKPAVRRQQEALAGHLAQPARPPRSALAEGRRAAFTLRLDEERHLKLRLACTIKNRSAQQIVIEALDKLLSDMPELNSLAKQVKQNKQAKPKK
jgi:hypothetical protein